VSSQSHSGLQGLRVGLHSSGAKYIRVFMTDSCLLSHVPLPAGFRTSAIAGSANLRGKMVFFLLGGAVLALAALCFPCDTRADKLIVPPETFATLDKVYSFDTDGAIADAQRMQEERPKHPLGYLLEAEALWWRIFCTSAEFRFGMTDARHRPKLASDQHYLELAAKASSMAQAELKTHETAEMEFYAGMGDAFVARLDGLRGENRATARAGVHAREHFLRALEIDPGLSDAEFGLGLYNYYVDTLSAIAKFLGFFMGIPSGNKQEGIRQLEHDATTGVLTPFAARFYLALNLHRYDQQYERALGVIGPLVEKYPSNPLFQLARGDLYAKLGRKEQALKCYRAAAELRVEDAQCRARIMQLVQESLAAQGIANARETQ